ncbi:ComF family protein [Clostridium sp. C105KSO13]|uniref:ComF family protein n=1 Tax=Clostridium sp. C105KSO13 TaxID=1776045 RepID=UPI000740786E|nr:DNA utilization protein GntX [Clostridium sp. C105KSO13]
MRCGKPVGKEEQEFCRDCSRSHAPYEQGRSLWVHRVPVSSAIYRFKYKNKRYYGGIFAEEMAKSFGEQIHRWKIEEIIPVPLHPARQKMRGYNQAQILAEELGKIVDIPVHNQTLYRIQNTRPQKSLDDVQRSRNLKGAFAVSKQYGVKKNVLIIDDIYTTGSTIKKAAHMLKLGGAEKVYFLTVSIGQGL